MAIRDLRNIDINLYDFVTSGLRSHGYEILSGHGVPYVASGIYVVDGYPEDFETLKAPSLSIEHDQSRQEPFQIGPGKQNIRRFAINIYARSDGERDDLGELVYNFFDSTMTIYDKNQFFQNGTMVNIGTADFDNIIMRSQRDTRFKSLKHQMNISFEAEIIVPTGNSLV